MALLITITNAGRAEIINAQNTGTDKVTITAVAFGTGQYTPSKTQSALQAEVKRVGSIAGQAVAADTIHVMAMDESNAAYNVGEFGLISDKGTLIAVYSQLPAAGWIIQKAAPSTLLLATDIILESLDTSVIEFGDISFINPPATTEVPGVVELATPTETIDGITATRAVTPFALKQLTATLARAGLVQLNNTLSSTSTTQALTAAQGKKLQDEKLPTSRVQTSATDTTVDALLTVGAFGLGTLSMAVVDDLNTLDVTGLYSPSSSTLNIPPSVVSGSTCLHISSSTTHATQLVWARSLDRIYSRRKSAGVWSDWVEIFHNGNLSPVETSRQITAGNGLTGGGTLAADRTLSLGTPGKISTSTSNSTTATSHTHELELPAASTSEPGIVQLNNTLTSTSTSQAATPNAVKEANDNANNRAPSSRVLTAGNGLTGGGSLGSDRTFALGTPGTVSTASSNNVSATSHTHALTLPAASTSEPGIVQLNNTLTSTSTSQALTAAQGKKLQDEKLPTSRVQSSATDTTAAALLTVGAFGLGTRNTPTFPTLDDLPGGGGLTIGTLFNLDASGLTLGDNLGGWVVPRGGRPCAFLFPNESRLAMTRFNGVAWDTPVEFYSTGNLSPVETSRQLTAGNGLTGGGTLAADRTLSLGTPGTLSGSTSNSVSGTSHTHALSAATDTLRGVIELATATEVAAGDATRAVTGATLIAGLLGLGNMGASGYVTFPFRDSTGARREFIFQWTTTGNVSSTMTPVDVTWPTTFPAACLGAACLDYGTSLSTIKSWKVISDGIDKVGAKVMFANDAGSGDGYGRVFSWGY
ncbi:tail fiber protein [Stutzerimonas sp.]|uniref:tail fiber protein n=1 Tax=Stutzerimonas sp. TaxID=2901166 RepID=UPI0035B03727